MRIEGGQRAKPSSIQHGSPERNNCPKALSHEKDVAAVDVDPRLEECQGIERILGEVVDGI